MDAAADTGLYTTRSGRVEHAYQTLKRDLLMGEFALGRRLAEERLAARLGVSRTPVREALARLHAERLVDRHPEGGYMPRPPDLLEMRQLYEVRFALERAALSRPRTTGQHHDADAIAALIADWEALLDAGTEDPDPSFVLLDEDFHVRLATASGNGELAQILSHVNERIRPVRVHDFMSGARIRSTVAEHLGVLHAVQRGDLDAAHAQIDDHFAASLEEVESRAAVALARMIAQPGQR